MIVRGGVDGQRHARREAFFECLLLGGVEPGGIVDVMEHGDEHVVTSCVVEWVGP